MLTIHDYAKPITDTAPCGEDISFSAALDAIVEARRHDDPTLDQGEWIISLKEANWSFVVQQCNLLLTTKSKDLRLAVWLAEANAKLRHFRGLGEGYETILVLCEKFWEGLYPLPEEGDYETRIGNLVWLLNRSVQLLRHMPITEGVDVAYTTADFDAARALAANADKASATDNTPDGSPKLAVLEAALRNTAHSFHENLLTDLQYCQQTLLNLEKLVDLRLGKDGPGFSAVKETLDNLIRTVSKFATQTGDKLLDKVNNSPMSMPIEPSANEVLVPTAEFEVYKLGPIHTRAQALTQLKLVADFFRRTEPHSPVAYLADKAALWVNMPLHAWLRTVIKDDTSLAQLEELLGVPPASSEDKR